MTEPDLEGVAWHEAGHLAVAYLVKRRVGVASIRPSAGFNGISFHALGPKIPPATYRRHLGHPLPLVPADLRRSVESSIMIALAGREAESLLRARSSARPAFQSETAGEQVAEGRARELSRPERVMLDVAEHSIHQHDGDKALSFANAAISDPTEAAAFLEWLKLVTRGLVRSRRCRQLIEALAAELLDHEVLSARAVRTILLRADGKEPKPRAAPAWDVAAHVVKGDEMQDQEVRPRIDPKTPISKLVVCMRTIYRSQAGAAIEGQIFMADDPRVQLLPDLFLPLIERIDSLWTPADFNPYA